MPPAPTVSVVIPVRDAAHLVAEQLAALEAQSYADFEVVVADNGSTDDTVEVVHGASGGLRLRVVDASGRPGVSHARNVGARHAAASKILFCDADDVADPGWVACMAAALDEAELVGGHLEVTSVNPPEVLAWSGSPTAKGLPVTMAYLPYAVGANLGVRRAVLDTVGEFDETYVGGHEEVDLAWKVQQAGMRVRFAPDAVIHYRLRGSLRGMARQRYWYGRSYAQLYRAFRGSGVEPTPLRRELRFYAVLVRSLPRDVRKGRFGFWLGTAAWTAGRLVGDLRFRVRCPL